MEIFATMLGGLGLFFVGIKLISTNLKQMTGRGFRTAVARATGRRSTASFAGLFAGALTQSTTAVSFISISLVTAGIMPLRAALPVVTWAHLGTSVLVLLAVLDFHLAVLLLLGIAGMAYYFDLDRGGRWRQAIGVLLGGCLLFLGLELMKQGAAPLKETPMIVDAIVAASQSFWLLLAVGFAVTIATNSSSTTAIIAVNLVKTGLLNFDQTMVMIYGATLAASVNIYILAAGLRGTARQICNFQTEFKFASALIPIVAFFIERDLHVPLFKSLASLLADDPAQQSAWIFVMLQLIGIAIALLFEGPLLRLAQRLAPTTAEEALSKPHFLYPQAIDHTATAVSLVVKEQNRLLAYLPEYLPPYGFERDDPSLPPTPVLARAAQAVNDAIDLFIVELLERQPNREMLESVLRAQAASDLLRALQIATAEFAAQIEVLHAMPAAADLAHGMNNALHTLLRTAADAAATRERDELDLLVTLTDDRTALMEQIRRNLVRSVSDGAAQTNVIFTATATFERSVWLLRRLAIALSDDDEAVPEHARDMLAAAS